MVNRIATRVEAAVVAARGTPGGSRSEGLLYVVPALQKTRTQMIASVSGIRGILGSDLSLADIARFASNFGLYTGSDEFLVARDTRSTGEVMKKTVTGALLSLGAKVLDFDVVSTPALFRESRLRSRPAVMVTASHNEPEFNGLKFLVAGLGVGKDTMDAVVSQRKGEKAVFGAGAVKRALRTSYNDDLVRMFGEGSCEGVRVALDLGGGAAVSHSVAVLRRLGCETVSINDAAGIFSRRIDPVSDELSALRRLVKARGCVIGLAFDCDGDRLVVVDDKGRKRTGDHMLSLAISRKLGESARKDVVVSVDTTMAVDEVVDKMGGKVVRSKVGEANVVGTMRKREIDLGGEGSSGGLIDGSFNYCRDSMLAALTIIGALKEGGVGFYDSVRSYRQSRRALGLPRSKALRAVKALARKNGDVDTTDGVKIWLSNRSWVLVRPSNTEDVVRISAEAETDEKAEQIVRKYSGEVMELSQ